MPSEQLSPETALAAIMAHHARTMEAVLRHEPASLAGFAGLAEAIFDQALLLALEQPEYAAALAAAIDPSVRPAIAHGAADLPRVWPIGQAVTR